MSESEIDAFLAEQQWLVLGTIGASGWPHLVTVGYYLLDGQITFTSYAKAQKVVNLRREPKVSCLIEDVGGSYNEVRGVLLRGQAHIVEDRDLVFKIHRLAMLRSGEWTVPAKPLEELVPKRVAVTVDVDSVASWDHAHLGGKY